MTGNDQITLVVADDHPLVLSALESLIRSQPELVIVDKCTNGAEALKSVRQHTPTIALLDVAMPGLSGLEVLAKLRTEGSPSRVVFLTASITDGEVYAAMKNGLDGIVLKDSAPDTLMECLRSVAAGGRWYPDQVVQAALAREESRRGLGEELASTLTLREREVLLAASEDVSNKEIARALNISEGTVKLHLHSIYQKLGIARRSGLREISDKYKDQLEIGNKSGG